VRKVSSWRETDGGADDQGWSDDSAYMAATWLEAAGRHPQGREFLVNWVLLLSSWTASVLGWLLGGHGGSSVGTRRPLTRVSGR